MKKLLFYFFLISIVPSMLLNELLIAQETNTLKVGDKAPLFIGKTSKGDSLHLQEILQDEKLVLVFYRGVWCPYCNKHLAELQKDIQLINAKDAKVVLITPEQPEFANKANEKANGDFAIISDSNYEIMKAYGVDFKISEETVTSFYNFVLKNTREANGNEEDILPVPATIIINQQGIIDYIHFDEDYKNRSSVTEILENL